MKTQEPIKVLADLIKKRNDLTEAAIRLDFHIKSAINFVKDLPERWYVENPNNNVLDYLIEKQIISEETRDDFILNTELYKDCGIGMIHGNYAFVPHDVDYGWQISQEAFDYFYIEIYKK